MKLKVLAMLLVCSSAFAGELELGAARALNEAERQTMFDNLTKFDHNGLYVCYRNLTNYSDDATLDKAASSLRTYTDKKTNDLYVQAYLTSTLDTNRPGGLPEGARWRHISENEYAIEYKKEFQSFSRNQAFTEVSVFDKREGVVQQVFKLENNKLVWVGASYNIQSNDDKMVPQVRCARQVKTLSKGLIFDSYEYKQDSISDLDLKTNMCRGNSTQCNTIMPAPTVIK